jgi:hypothetical protein
MAILLTFILGVANFALHRAVLESGHPLIGRMPWFYHAMSRRFSLAVEFLMLFAGMLLAAQGEAWGLLGYIAYSALNGVAGWLILTRRV